MGHMGTCLYRRVRDVLNSFLRQRPSRLYLYRKSACVVARWSKADSGYGADGRTVLAHLPFPFLSGKGFSKADSDAGIPCAVISATVARRLFGTTEATGQTLQLNHVDYRVSGVVADVSMLATSAYGQVWVPYNSTDAAGFAWWENTMGQMKAVILAHSSADFPAIREEAERLRLAYNAGLSEAETFYRDQPDGVFANLYRKWDHLPDMKGIVLRYALVITILLLVPAINLSSMTLSRMRKRMSEIGVRKAFGATGSELVRQVFSKPAALSVGGYAGAGFELRCYFFIERLPLWQ